MINNYQHLLKKNKNTARTIEFPNRTSHGMREYARDLYSTSVNIEFLS